LLELRKPYLGCSFSNRVFSVDGKNVSGGLCSFGASIELVKNVSEMFVFLNLTLQSFGPENFKMVSLGKTKAIKWCITYSQHAILVGRKWSETKPARNYAPTQ
jgi:hypothetical protein